MDTDGDGVGNNADTDDDGDGVPDISDAYPLDPTRGEKPTLEVSSGGGGAVSILWILFFGLLMKKRNY